MRRRCDRSYGLGPLSFFESSGAPGGDPAAGAPAPEPAPAGGAPATPPASGEPDRSGWIPRDRFDQVNAEREALRKEKESREQADLTAKGEHEKVAANEKAKREEAEARALKVARRAAFIAKGSGAFSDVEAAYKLAAMDGDLDKIEVTDDGEPKDAKAVEAIVTDLGKRYEFLKIDKRSFGGPSDGQRAQNGGHDPKTADEMLRAAFASSPVRERR
jgi:hypothetical protein